MVPSSRGSVFEPHARVDELKKMTARDQAFDVSVRRYRKLVDVVPTHIRSASLADASSETVCRDASGRAALGDRRRGPRVHEDSPVNSP